MARKARKARTSKAKTETKSVVPALYRDRYEDGRSCGDAVAKKFAKLLKDSEDVAATVKSLAQKNGVWKGEYASLNGGLVRMTVGNRLRKLARDGHEVNWSA